MKEAFLKIFFPDPFFTKLDGPLMVSWGRNGRRNDFSPFLPSLDLTEPTFRSLSLSFVRSFVRACDAF